ncbi:MAG: hypothetical protein M1546_25565 [Chloroflexi bacterium]|nr:hypothetical protein [Chloroflexota bacterium]
MPDQSSESAGVRLPPLTLQEVTNLVSRQLAAGQGRDVIIQQLVTRGWPEVSARHFVTNAAQTAHSPQSQAAQHAGEDARDDEERAVVAELYRRRMIRGLVWALTGLFTLAMFFNVSQALGGVSLFFMAAIIFGAVDFVVGLIGWWRNRN